MAENRNEFQLERFRKGDTIFREGESGDCAYLIRSGVVKIYRMMDNTKLSITHLKAGQIMGEMAVISVAPRSASAEAAEDCELVKIDVQSLNIALDKTLPVIKAMLNQLIHRFRTIDRQSSLKEIDKILICASTVMDLIHRDGPEKEYTQVFSLMRSRFGVTEAVLENIVHKLADQGLIEESEEGGIRRLKIKGGPGKEGPEKAIKSLGSDDTFIPIETFAKVLKTTPKDVIVRAGIGDIPEKIFYISREQAALWAEDIGEDYFDDPIKE